MLQARTGQDQGEGDFPIYAALGMIVASAPCNWVTIHTGIPFRVVDETSADVNGANVRIARIYSDSRGHLVVRLESDDVWAQVAPPSATITLTVIVDGDAMVASGTVAVRK